MTNFIKLKNRIKKNEGFRSSFYLDSLGNPTIGYGHLIKKNEKKLLKKKYSKLFLTKVFNEDFNNAVIAYNKFYEKEKYPQNIKEVLIEMIFQLGIHGQRKFKKMNYHINKRELFMAALEMKKSLWCLQTPNRVRGLVKILLKRKNEK